MQNESNKKMTGVSPVSVGVVNNNVAPDFKPNEDIHISVRENYYWQFKELPQLVEYLRDKTHLSFLN
jgi:uncharacterized protein YneR